MAFCSRKRKDKGSPANHGNFDKDRKRDAVGKRGGVSVENGVGSTVERKENVCVSELRIRHT